MKPMQKYVNLMPLVLALWLVVPPPGAAQTVQLRDYTEALRNPDRHRVQVLKAYMRGAADTHVLYSRMLRDWTGITVLCPGAGGMDTDELAALVELKIHALRRRYGEDIMGMRLATVVQMIMEEQFKC